MVHGEIEEFEFKAASLLMALCFSSYLATVSISSQYHVIILRHIVENASCVIIPERKVRRQKLEDHDNVCQYPFAVCPPESARLLAVSLSPAAAVMHSRLERRLRGPVRSLRLCSSEPQRPRCL